MAETSFSGMPLFTDDGPAPATDQQVKLQQILMIMRCDDVSPAHLVGEGADHARGVGEQVRAQFHSAVGGFHGETNVILFGHQVQGNFC